MASPDHDDRDRSRDVRRSHSPLKLEPLGAGGLWRAMVPMFYCIFACCGCVLLRRAPVSERGEILGRWSLGLQLKNLNEGFNTKKPQDSSFSRWFAGCLFLDLHTKE
jgi:hypothetical protein